MTRGDDAADHGGLRAKDALLVDDLAASFLNATREHEEFVAAVGAMNLFGHLIEAFRQLPPSLSPRARYRRIVARHRLRLVLGHLVFRSGGAYVAIAGVVAAFSGAYYAREQARISGEQSRLTEIQTRAAEAQARAADAEYIRGQREAYVAERSRLRSLLFNRAPFCPPAALRCPYGRCPPVQRVCPLEAPIELRASAAVEFVDLERRWRARSEPANAPIDLQRVELQRAHLAGVDLSDVDLRFADLTEAHLAQADLTGAWLQGAVLRDAQLGDAKLDCAHLADADLRGARTIWASFNGADLSSAVGAEVVFGGIGPSMATYDEFTDFGRADVDLSGWRAISYGNLDELFEVEPVTGSSAHERCARQLGRATDAR